MNGTTLVEDGSVVDRRPIITCAGELEVFSVIEDNLVQALPQDSCDWRRSLGRPVRPVHIGASFTPFSPAALPKANQWDLIRQPLFHIYWTECTDVDVYKNSIKEDIENWFKELSSKDIQDWLIVVVENFDGKRTNKLLPRTTVLDKIRADFAPKQGDRCISVINPGKVESRSADSWRGLIVRIRHLLLVSYARAVSRLEDHVRQQRERRNEIGWDFMQYFHLQEELAQVLEMLGLNDEALVQYDELDALFSQFVVNGITSECVNWLNNFQKPLEKWHGLKLGPSKLSNNPSILELRAYLFAKQAHMLLLTNKVWEVRSLGELCGLMPGGVPNSEQLHTVVLLSAGMGDNPGTPNHPSPTDKLKEALCSQDAFNKTYLELAELAMGTYKHIGRLRSARLVGREVASFYMLLGETQKSAAFLGDALRTFEQDGWHELAAQTQIELAECFKKAKDLRKLIRASAFVSAALEIDTLIRWTYFDEMRKCLDSLDKPLVVPFNDIIKIVSVGLKNENVIMQDSNINVELVIASNFPREIVCTNLVISLEADNKEHKKTNEKYSTTRMLTSKDMKLQDPMLQRLRIKKNLDYKQDKQLATAGIASKFTELKRKDSTAPHVQDFNHCLEVSDLPLVLTPGINIIRLNKQASKVGKYYIGQVAIHIKNLHLVSANLTPRLALEVKEEGPSLKLYKRAAPLLSGIEQIMNLILTIGSYSVEPKSKIKLTASPGLTLQVNYNEPLTSTLELEVGKNLPFTSTRTPLRVLADMLSRDPQVTIHCPWTTKPIVVVLNFTPPLTAVWRLHTMLHRKFVQVSITGQCEKDLIIDQATLKTLYILDAEVEPAKGSEFCRVGIVCHLHLSMESASSTLQTNNNVKSVMYEVLAEQSVWAVCGRTAGVVCFDTEEEPQTVVLDVMPLTSGHLPLPLVRISKYIPAEFGTSDKPNKGDTHPRLEPFSPGQVYNKSKGKQLHVIAAVTEGYQ
ncbi:hypothetical protein NQ314_016646 [Rhamnusium bicolor]|uniref:Trafficking protein particle complex subunit 10 n=1 Tax=Rhamnusium bicolor TaxID=1586634 RepID=A0AAV8WV55_9CUCU|nr:hypothetical protein NQ314_016646 [Rhamnusium bicolor]